MPTETRVARSADGRRDSIGAILAALDAPAGAAANLDALADVLRDLSWLQPGPVTLRWRISSELPEADRWAVSRVLLAAVRETSGAERPLRVQFQPLAVDASSESRRPAQEHSD